MEIVGIVLMMEALPDYLITAPTLVPVQLWFSTNNDFIQESSQQTGATLPAGQRCLMSQMKNVIYRPG